MDARGLARFCTAHALHPWSPTSVAHQQLHVLGATRQTLMEQAQLLRNRQHAAGYTPCPDLVRDLQAPVLAAITAQLARIDQELARVAEADTLIGRHVRLLTTIPGLGLTTAATLVAGLPVARLPTPKHVAAEVGLCPREKTSGVSVRGRSTIGSLGPAHLRSASSLPAIVAMRANPQLRAFAERLRAKGTPGKVVIVAWTLLRTGQPFAARVRPLITPRARVRPGRPRPPCT